MDASGALYGSTQNGSACKGGCGVAFKYVPSTAAFTVLHQFIIDEGILPSIGSIGPDGTIYGTTRERGPGNGGTLFELIPSGAGAVLSTLFAFGEHHPDVNAGVFMKHLRSFRIAKSAGNCTRAVLTLMGLAAATHLSPAFASHYQAIYRFKGAPDGEIPATGLISDSQGRLYGTTIGGGVFGQGTVFRLTRPASGRGVWTEEILHSFNTSDGESPEGPVTLGADGSVYGTTIGGGAQNRGVVFRLSNTAGWPITLLHSFLRDEGGWPRSNILFGSTGLLYGTTSYLGNASYADTGTVFSVSPLGDQVEYTLLHVFGKGIDGTAPQGLTSAPSSYFNGFLGAAAAGGTARLGTIFALKLNSGGRAAEATLYDFGVNADVTTPTGLLVAGKFAVRKAFFGCAATGGDRNYGGIYRVVPNSTGSLTESVLYSFGDQPGDPAPSTQPGACSLVQADASGKMYGTTEFGGASGYGTFFELDPPTSSRGSWKLTVDVSFDPASPSGGYPIGTPLRIGSLYYGTNTTSINGYGINGYGTVYELRP